MLKVWPGMFKNVPKFLPIQVKPPDGTGILRSIKNGQENIINIQSYESSPAKSNETVSW